MWKRFLTPLVLLPLAVVIFFAGLIIGYFIPYPSPFSTSALYAGANIYSHVNPLLSCGDITNVSEGKIKTAKENANQFIEEQKKKGLVEDVSVYFRDLDNGGWFLLDNDLTFSPGSLLKVPVMMSAYKMEERKPHFLSEQVLFATSSKSNLVQLVSPQNPLEVGKSYTVKELIQRMIRGSDNAATTLVYQTLGEETVNATFDDLGLPHPSLTGDYSITIKDYSRFFRILYNATYLSPEKSEEALRVLTESEFNKGLVAGVPEGIEIAHKFGERELARTNQLHDCGIIYAEKHPYILCIMTRGQDTDSLAEAIAGISRIVYRDIHD